MKPSGAHNSRRSAAFNKLAIDYDVSLPDDLTALQNTVGTYGQCCSVRQVNRAVFQMALDLNLTVFTEFERGTPQYIPLAKETFGSNRIQRGACAQACFQSEVVIDQLQSRQP